MYKISDYLRNGVLYLNNTLRPHHKRLSTLMIYSTTKCQSRCKHCSIWKKPEEHGSPDKPRGLSIQPCKSEKEEPYICHSSQGRSECLYLRIE